MKIRFVKIENDIVAAADFYKALNWYRGEIDPNIDRAVTVSGSRVVVKGGETLQELAEKFVADGGELPAVIFTQKGSADA